MTTLLQNAVADWAMRLAQGGRAGVAATIADLSDYLTAQRDSLDPAAWDEAVTGYRASELLPILLEDPLTRRGYHRPTGMPGDAGWMDLIHAHGAEQADLPNVSATGRAIHAALQNRPFAKAMRTRSYIAAALLGRVLADSHAAPDCLILSAGHLPELDAQLAEEIGPVGNILALDADPVALNAIRRRLPQVETLCAAAQEVVAGKLEGRFFDSIHSLGLLDHLPDAMAERLLSRLVRMLRPDGRLMVFGFAPDAVDRGYLEVFMDWKMVHRDEDAMARLAGRVGLSCDWRISRENSGQVVILELQRNG